MSLALLIIVGLVLSLIFHFIGVYADAKKLVWTTILLLWAATISIAMSEIKQKGYDDLKKMQGKYTQTDTLIENSLPEISLYEMIVIKNSFNIQKRK